MKHIFVLILLLATACSDPGGGSDEPVPPRPGEDSPLTEAKVTFDPAKADFAAADGSFEGSLPIAVLRSGEYLPDTLYIIETADPRAALRLPGDVHFGQNATKTIVTAAYRLSLAPGQSYGTTVRVAGTDAAIEITFRNTSDRIEVGLASYRFPGGRRTATVFRRTAAAGTEYSLEDEGFTRSLTVDAAGGVVMNAAPAACEGFVAVADASHFTDAPPALPAWGVTGATDGDGTFVLAAVYTSADGTPMLHHDTVTILDPDSDWEAPADAMFTDGWLLGVVSLDARPPLLPADNPWPVEYRESRSRPGVLRLCNPYRGASPLAEINGGAALAYIIVDASNPDNVTIAPQNSGFANADLFAAPFMAGGTGTMTTAPDGTRTITIPRPLHNGYGTWGDTWATIHPALITLPAPPC